MAPLIHWSDEETRTLMSIYGAETTQKQLEGATRNMHIYRSMSSRLKKMGFHKTPEQCRARVKNMRHKYKTIKDHNKQTGSSRKDWKYFDFFEKLLNHQPVIEPMVIMDTKGEKTDLSCLQDLQSINDDHLQEICNNDILHKTTEYNTSEDNSDAKYCPLTEENADTKYCPLADALLPVEQAGRKLHWSDEETWTLVSIYSEKSTQDELDGSNRNMHIYKNMSDNLMRLGFHKTPEQCRGRLKNMRHKYRSIKYNRNNNGGNDGKDWKYFEVFDKILSDRPVIEPMVIIDTLDKSELNYLDSQSSDDVCLGGATDAVNDAGDQGPSGENAVSNYLPLPDPLEEKGKKRKCKEHSQAASLENLVNKFLQHNKEQEIRFLQWEERRIKAEEEKERRRELREDTRREQDRAHYRHMMEMLTAVLGSNVKP